MHEIPENYFWTSVWRFESGYSINVVSNTDPISYLTLLTDVSIPNPISYTRHLLIHVDHTIFPGLGASIEFPCRIVAASSSLSCAPGLASSYLAHLINL